jgi:hypothetical protein
MGDDKYENSSMTKSFKVTEGIKLDINGTGNSSTLVITVPGNETGGNVTVYIDGKNITANVTNGTAIINLTNVTPGKQDIQVIYVDRNGTSSETNGTVNVPKWSSAVDFNVTDIREGAVETIPIEVAKENKNSLWTNIKGADQYNCIMTCSIREGTPGLKSVGLLENHSFSLVSAFERKVGNETLKLMKMRNPFGEGEWNGDWSDKSPKWTDAAKKAFPEFDAKGGDDGIFWIDFDNFCKYFQIVSICVPLKPLSSTFIKIDKDKASSFNVLKIKVEGDGILSVAVYKKSYRFHRKIQPDQEVIENLVLARIEGDKLEYLDSAYNETMSTYVKSGEYICIYNVDYKTAGVSPRKYALTISASVKFEYAQLDPDDDKSLLKKIMLPKIESLPKYKSRFENAIVLFTGNRFEQTAIGFFYIKSRMEGTIHLEPKVFFQNIKSIDGELPKGLKMEKNTIFLYLGNRVKAALPFRTGGNGKTVENAVPGEVTPKLDENKVKNYGNASNYEDVKIAFEC